MKRLDAGFSPGDQNETMQACRMCVSCKPDQASSGKLPPCLPMTVAVQVSDPGVSSSVAGQATALG